MGKAYTMSDKKDKKVVRPYPLIMLFASYSISL